LEDGCNSTEFVCLDSGNTYKPYACGGNYPSEITWIISAFTGSDDYFDDGNVMGDDDDLYKKGGGSVLCDWAYCGSVTLVVPGGSTARRLTEEEHEKRTPPAVLEKMKAEKEEALARAKPKAIRDAEVHQQQRRKLRATDAPTSVPSSIPSALPTTLPSLSPTVSPTHAPTIDYRYDFGLTDYVL
jgi:hypothetical protein